MSERKKIIIAEDDKDICRLLSLYLRSEYDVLTAYDGGEALLLIKSEKPDLGIFDIMLPVMDGYELLKRAREFTDMPVIFASAKNSDQEKILGLDLGADDYIGKPFNPLEVTARVRALLRRSVSKTDAAVSDEPKKTLVVKDISVDLTSLVAKKNGVELPLTATELRILILFMRHPGWVFTKKQIIEQISDGYLESDINSVRVHISNLREKLGVDADNNSYIKTVRGLGYKFIS
ncbi:MAG: response regulator transcription factor [Candidatus Weimeria sp.]